VDRIVVHMHYALYASCTKMQKAVYK